MQGQPAQFIEHEGETVLLIPDECLAYLGAKVGDDVEVEASPGKLVLYKVKPPSATPP